MEDLLVEFWAIVESKRAQLRAREGGKVRTFEKLAEYRYEQFSGSLQQSLEWQ
jgi:hypothetical protein